MPPPRPLPLELRGRPFTVLEALQLGMTRDQLRGPHLRAPHRGVRVPAALPDTLRVRCAAARLVLPEAAAVSGPTGVALWGLPQPLGAPDVLEGPLHVVVPPPRRAPRLPDVEAAQSRFAPSRLTRRGLPVLHPVHLWCDLAPDLPLDDAVALGDAVRRRWARAEALTEAVRSREGQRGAEQLRRVLALVRHPVDSAMETLARLQLTRAGLPEPVCGRDVVVDGAWVARPDLSWPEVRVAVEHDGDHHRTDPHQWRSDVRRKQLLEACGWRVVVLTADDLLRRPEQTAALVASALRERGLRW
ncbi:endonuclease domain-containing protein [Quadrisphaera sp. DSM 44207]|uniref:endonuclease domain-containing protein n=1 Tax=Quadrisphaera sp. DSM 44207 TaxID=1881057 RepID=UPI00087E3B49|nr:DUF559 domain-containing protein [Quadrisphaera sp. DSM 44207]SDQ48948.1 Protein of unknown function [Quadrisphaera sp. DSM 44207]